EITNVLKEFGYFFPKLSVRIVPREAVDIADLVVDIAAEGPHGTLDSIEIYGNHKNSRQEILRLLKLKPGMAIQQDLIAKTELRLWNSGRFLEYKVRPDPAPGKKSSVKLVLDLTEYKEAPPLSQAFAPAEAALLKMRQWLLTAFSRGQ